METACADDATRVGQSRSPNGGGAELECYLRSRYEIASGEITVAGHTLGILRPASVDDLIDESDFNRDGRLPYWADIWPSSLALAERLVSEPAEGRSLLELGCGVGFVACVASKLGFRVTASDYYRAACEFTRLNAHRNRLPIPRTRLVDWRDYPADLGEFEVVVASDVLYEKPNCDLVAACFVRSLAADGLGILADPQRTLAVDFPAECRRVGLSVIKKSSLAVKTDARGQEIDVYDLRRLK